MFVYVDGCVVGDGFPAAFASNSLLAVAESSGETARAVTSAMRTGNGMDGLATGSQMNLFRGL
jgi:hypothetical protein